jgi:hypothetical protein
LQLPRATTRVQRDDALVTWLASRAPTGRELVGEVETNAVDSSVESADGRFFERVDAVFELVGGG